MSFQAIFYRFAKKVNSTKQPAFALEPNIVFNVTLKDVTDILNPTLMVKSDFIDLGTGEFFTPNYVRIDKFERYYYVTNMKWARGVWEVQCKVDVLASYKDEIGAEQLYVTRSAGASNGDIIDNKYPTETDATLEIKLQTGAWDLNAPYYVVGVAGTSTDYYAMSPSQLNAFFTYIFSTAYATSLDALALAYPSIQYDANPLQFITSVKWFPFTITGGTPVASIQVGSVSCPVSANLLSAPYLYSDTTVVTIDDRHPQALSRGSYLNYEPFSRYSLTFPPFGEFDLDAVNIAQASQITLDTIIDLRTGGGTLTVIDDSLNRMNRLHADIGVDYQVSQVVSRGFGVAQIVNAGAGLLSSAISLDPAGAVGSVTGSIGEYAKSKVPKATTIGSNGGVDALFGSIALQSTFYNLVNEDNTRNGRPLCAVRTINTLSGFIQVEKADIDIATAHGEQDEIRAYLEGGFYYE